MPKEVEFVTLFVDGQAYQVPKGMNLVDAAKYYANNDIPVFCYHPKMNPVGMCRMCLVEIGNSIDRQTNDIKYGADGTPEVMWFPKLQTACTTLVTHGLAVRTATPKVQDARDDVIEFLLTSHPLDCPICDKGGECPLQNLTLRHGAGVSRFDYENKLHLEKHVPLGDLIFLDRERCIQCARCTRFCDELVGDPVLGFHERGRSLQIVTLSDPPFDTYFSGNTTDICPVGALTTADFRFAARPWELNEVPSLDPYGPEGANITLSTRLDRDSGGITIIKRVRPRQNEYVNEIWISDKTRFGHHHSRAEHRLKKPLVRREDGTLEEVSWTEAFNTIAEVLKKSGGSVGAVAGPMLSNEDLWELRQLVESAGGSKLGVWPAAMTGAEVVAQVGVANGTNFKEMGKGTTIVVVASDLEEEAPVWFLRAKQAHDRGAKLMLLTARPTKLDKYAACILRHTYGETTSALQQLTGAVINSEGFVFDESRAEGYHDIRNASYSGDNSGYAEAARMLTGAENVVVFVGHEGLTLAQHGGVVQAAANLLILTGHTGRPNNGLIPVWPGANTQGAFDLGYSAEATVDALSQSVVILAGADPIGTDPAAKALLASANFIVATSLFETATTAIAHVILPRQSVPERDGTLTSGERRVQRFYAAQGVIGDTLPDWKMFARISNLIDPAIKVKVSAAAVMNDIVKGVPRYANMNYKNLAWNERQFPDVGGDDLYYGGTAYRNDGGLGVQWPVEAEIEGQRLTLKPITLESEANNGLLAVPVRRLYDRSPEFLASELMYQRIPVPYAEFNYADAEALKVIDGESVTLRFGDYRVQVTAKVDNRAPEGVILIPINLTREPVPTAPTAVEVEK
ncbi:MAG: NADH-quinone oxidoreductase subunit NuoG [Anaerolineae bacterium]|nr:NADH-quinone oxidoreductase subunit NuoG [Anaerolineae bacterium]